jgi:predicted ester cyclase
LCYRLLMLVRRSALAGLLGVGAAFCAAPLAVAAPNGIDERERNRDSLRRATELLNRGDVSGYVAYWADNALNFGRAVGRAGIERVIRDILVTFPDWNMRIDDMVAEGDELAALFTVSGTHLGIGQTRANGGMLTGVAPTRKGFTIQHIHWYRFRDGQIAEHNANRDDLGMLLQLGLIKRD